MSNTYKPTVLRNDPKPPRPVMYAVGVRHSATSVGMSHGPSASEVDMLEVVGTKGAILFRFNADGTDEELWKWNEQQQEWQQ